MMVLFPTILILKASVVPSTMESIYVVSVAWKPPLSAQSVMSIIVVVITRWLPGVSITKNIVEKETNLFLCCMMTLRCILVSNFLFGR